MEDYFDWFDPDSWLDSIVDSFNEGLGLLATPINALATAFNNFIEDVVDFFTSLISSLENWFTDINTGLGTWFSDTITSIEDTAIDLNAKIKIIIDDATDIIITPINSIITGIETAISYINPFSDNFFLKIAFIPDEQYLLNKSTELKNVINAKFGFINYFKDNLSIILGANDGITGKSASSKINLQSNIPPSFDINLPEKWGGTNVPIIDFTVFAVYRDYIFMFIRVLLWVPFLIKMYKRIPSFVKGAGGS